MHLTGAAVRALAYVGTGPGVWFTLCAPGIPDFCFSLSKWQRDYQCVSGLPNAVWWSHLLIDCCFRFSQEAHCKFCPPPHTFKLTSLFLRRKYVNFSSWYSFCEYVQVYFETPDKIMDSGLVSLIYQTSVVKGSFFCAVQVFSNFIGFLYCRTKVAISSPPWLGTH